MSTTLCTMCSAEIPAREINATEGIAFCRACNVLVRVDCGSEEAELAPADPARPPRGCRLSDDGLRLVVGVSCRAPMKALIAFGIAVFWNGILSVFVLIALANTIHHIHGSAPAWLPAPPISGNAPGSAGLPFIVTLLLWVFLVPFMVIGADLVVTVLFALFGRVEVRLAGGQGRVVTAIGPLRWWRRFDAADVASISTGKSAWWQEGDDRFVVNLEGESRIRFGSMIPRPRRAWMVAVLKQRLGKEPARARRVSAAG